MSSPETDFRGWVVSQPVIIGTPEGESIQGRLETLVKVPVRIPDYTGALPLQPSPVSEWSPQEDLFVYVRKVRSVEMTIVAPDGETQTGINKFDLDTADEVVKSCEHEIELFSTRLGAGRDDDGRPTVAELRADPTLGQALKYLLAWQQTEQEFLEEALFFSIQHLIEATEELRASVTLAQRDMYKQATSPLRSFLENALLPVHFCLNSDEFDLWRRGQYRLPPVRGKKGLLSRLLADGLITNGLKKQLDTLFDALNGVVHSAEAHMTVSPSGRNPRKPGWSLDRLHEWAELFSTTVDVGLRLLLTTVTRWDERQPTYPFCATCHNATSFDVSAERFADHVYDSITCVSCGHHEIRPLNLARDLSVTEPDLPDLPLRFRRDQVDQAPDNQ